MDDPNYSDIPRRIALLRSANCSEAEVDELRNDIIAHCMPLAEHISRRYVGRGEQADDLKQVALVGLINAVDRFNPEFGDDFLAFAVPTIMGEVRRHFRDTRWAVRVPRRLQEVHLAIGNATAELVQKLGRAPTSKELADDLDITLEQLEQAQLAGSAFSAQSVDVPRGNDSDSQPFMDAVGEPDVSFERFENHDALRAALDALPPRERTIIIMRFFGNKTQEQIAAQLNISQMHVSRLLTKTLRSLRGRIDGD
ncbi:SigB/SigF/SigG family RNA polymerase sigma factor [Hoyosella rhizosphaerae]|uniref:RNA polymerase sigma factor n=1 Tax=Hoyosella rhizosphaerae TaxID=1755582 RepID=A0A916U362_9ACTN|nr:SigB/SigF/SigG family RNA polymerase sigma factor [Hoyosella rhizosphaerae]MBN4926937.1 SigB/SigF/SigG family RNA polymerase sigma factor [Hoyosella rhizosphaerae]GGC55349.1 RNA polymerase sigma factor [Hoyosella rhizosphaerae]